jgi:hypothetical protein
MESIDFTPKNYFVSIICFKIKNPPTLDSTSKIQPITSPTKEVKIKGGKAPYGKW